MADTATDNDTNLPRPDDTPDILGRGTNPENSGNIDEAHEVRGGDAKSGSPNETPSVKEAAPPNGKPAGVEVSPYLARRERSQVYLMNPTGVFR